MVQSKRNLVPKPSEKKIQIDISGRLEHVVFHNPENHYTIARLRADDGRGRITILGHLPKARSGARLCLKGGWERHPRWGDQFRFVSVEEVLPAEVDEIRSYLTAGLIKGLGARTALRVLDHFGADTLVVLDSAPERLTEVRGVGPKSAAKITAAWQAHQSVRLLMAFLKANGVPAAHAARLMKVYGDEALHILKRDPYRVAAEMPRFGFEIADAIVQRSDMAIPADQRAQACLLHLLEQAESQGHCYLPKDHLIQLGNKRFDLPEDDSLTALTTLAATHEVVVDDLVHTPESETESASPAVFSAYLHHCETQIVERLAVLAQLPPAAPPPTFDTLQEMVSHRLAMALSRDQLRVLEGVLGERLAIVTGGPGTGKTTLIRCLAAVFESKGKVIALAAPTGRAARRMAAVTGRSATTIHRLLGYSLAEGRFRRDRSDPLDLDLLILDEASMLDLPLCHHLLAALPFTARLILVGDAYQLPSVGPGAVLADLIKSRTVPTFSLETIYRQARNSEIVVSAHRIRRGEPFELEMPPGPEAVDLEDGGDFYFIPVEGPAEVAGRIVALVSDLLPARFDLDPLTDIQVLTPMHKGEVGTLQLNQALQAALNPPLPDSRSKARFRRGDKAIQMRNNYAKEVFNGEVGVVTAAGTQETVVVFEGREVVYEGDAADELSLAYAISIHKSQGSEYPAVVVPLVTQHYIMLQRNLLYTAMTRGERLVVLVGSPKALRVALANDRPMRRHTGLAARLASALPVSPTADPGDSLNP
jgi:exodeoxyribonuclease V alpha subunit